MKACWSGLVLLAVLMMIGAAGLSTAQEEKWESESFFGPQNGWKVTMTRGDQQLAVLEIREGFLSIYSSTVPESDRGIPRRFQGNMLVKVSMFSDMERAMRASADVSSGVRSLPMDEVMSDAPLKMMLNDTVVTVEYLETE